MSSNHIRFAGVDDSAAIARIYNQGIEDRGATFETRLRIPGDIEPGLRDSSRFATLVAEAGGEVIAWASLSPYRPRACYDGIAEFSLYVERASRGRGVGLPLLEALLDTARERGFWKVIARVFPTNLPSLALCRQCGFRQVGVYERHAQLEGEWRDVVILERLILENCSKPTVSVGASSVRTSE
jgi:L-amino acid N-acyltransferase YncA